MTEAERIRARELLEMGMSQDQDRKAEWYQALEDEDRRILQAYIDEQIGQVNSIKRTIVEVLLPAVITAVEAIKEWAEVAGKALSQHKETQNDSTDGTRDQAD